MSELTSKQRKFLRSEAHSLKPVVQIGQNGLSEGVLRELNDALDSHELIKVRVAADREERDEIIPELLRLGRAELAGAVGKVAILYRQHPQPEKRKIRLPA